LFELYRAEAGQPEAYPNLQAVLTRPINGRAAKSQAPGPFEAEAL
jgi:hypothetical protein